MLPRLIATILNREAIQNLGSAWQNLVLNLTRIESDSDSIRFVLVFEFCLWVVFIDTCIVFSFEMTLFGEGEGQFLLCLFLGFAQIDDSVG